MKKKIGFDDLLQAASALLLSPINTEYCLKLGGVTRSRGRYTPPTLDSQFECVFGAVYPPPTPSHPPPRVLGSTQCMYSLPGNETDDLYSISCET